MTTTFSPKSRRSGSHRPFAKRWVPVAVLLGAASLSPAVIHAINAHHTEDRPSAVAASTVWVADSDGLGRALSVTYPTVPASANDPDGLGRALSVTYPTVPASANDPDGLGRALSVTYPTAKL